MNRDERNKRLSALPEIIENVIYSKSASKRVEALMSLMIWLADSESKLIVDIIIVQ